jgi:serine/threonine protein kinase
MRDGQDLLTVKLIDFGLAKAQEILTTICGNRGTGAPEVMLRNGPYNERVDIWSTGILVASTICQFPKYTAKHVKEPKSWYVDMMVHLREHYDHHSDPVVRGMLHFLVDNMIIIDPDERSDAKFCHAEAKKLLELDNVDLLSPNSLDYSIDSEASTFRKSQTIRSRNAPDPGHKSLSPASAAFHRLIKVAVAEMSEREFPGQKSLGPAPGQRSLSLAPAERSLSPASAAFHRLIKAAMAEMSERETYAGTDIVAPASLPLAVADMAQQPSGPGHDLAGLDASQLELRIGKSIETPTSSSTANEAYNDQDLAPVTRKRLRSSE